MGSKERNIILTDYSESYSPTIISGLLFHYILLFKNFFHECCIHICHFLHVF